MNPFVQFFGGAKSKFASEGSQEMTEKGLEGFQAVAMLFLEYMLGY